MRTSPANLEEIKRVLASLDTTLRQFLVTMRQGADWDRRRNTVEVSGNIDGRDGRVTMPLVSWDPRGGTVVLQEGDDRVRARVVGGRAVASERSTQSIRVLEGSEAFVRVGQVVPVRGRQVQRAVVGGRVVEQVVERAQYSDVTTGFYVRPRVSGDRVTLKIGPPARFVVSTVARNRRCAKYGPYRIGSTRRVDGCRGDRSGLERAASRIAGTRYDRHPRRSPDTD